MDLLAQATLPGANAGTIQATIVANIPSAQDGTELRLVVQSFDGSPRPLGSIQRAVTRAELRAGVHVRLVELRTLGSLDLQSRVIAWVERGRPDLELDARTAKPGPRAFFGEALGTDVRIVLSRGRPFQRAA